MYMPLTKQVLTIAELQEALGGISRSTLAKLRKAGWFRHTPGILRGMKFPVWQLENYLKGTK